MGCFRTRCLDDGKAVRQNRLQTGLYYLAFLGKELVVSRVYEIFAWDDAVGASTRYPLLALCFLVLGRQLSFYTWLLYSLS